MPEYVVTGPDGKEYEVTAPDGASDSQIIQQVQKYIDSNSAPAPVDTGVEEPSNIRGAADVGVGFVAGVPKALGALTSLGSLVPGVHYIADPISQGLYSMGEGIENNLLSDYQLDKNAELTRRIEAAAATIPDMPEDASMAEKAEFVYDHMIAQGGEAAEYLKENPGQTINLIAQTIPHIFAGGVVAKGVKGASAAAGLKPISSATAGAIGEGAVAAGDSVANIVRQDYEGFGTGYDAGRLYGVPAGLGTSLISRAGAKFNQFDVDTAVAGGAKDLLGQATKGSITKSAVKGAAVEGAEEFLQSGQEQMFTNLGQGREFYEDVGSSAVLGLATGAPLGGSVSAASQVMANRQANVASEAEIVQQAEEEAQLQEQAAREEAELEAQQQAEKAQQSRVRREAAQTFTPREEFVKARQAEATAQLELDIKDPSTEIGQTFEAHLNDQNIFDPKDIDKAAKTFIKNYQKENDNTDTINQDYVTALDAHAQLVEQAKAVVEENPSIMEMDEEAFSVAEQTDPAIYGVVRQMRLNAQPVQNVEPVDAVAAAATVDAATQEAPVEQTKKLSKKEQLSQLATEQLGETWEQDYAELSALIGDGKSIYSKGKGKKSRFESMLDKIVAEKTQAETPVAEQTAETVEETTPAQEEEATATPEVATGIEAQAISYATDKIGENWRNESQLVDLLQAQDYPAFQAEVDKVAEKTVVATQPAAETAVDNAVVELFAQPLPAEVKLSANEQAVFDTLNQAFQNNEQDDVIQSDGSLNPTRIAERAGLKSRQAAQTAITRLRPKIARAYGLDQKQIKQKLAETRNKNTEAFDPNAETSEMDLSELGDGFGTVASANQGARDGMSQEDQAFLDEMPETPVRIQTQEERDIIKAQVDAEIRKNKLYQAAAETWDNGFESDVAEENRVPFESMDAGSRMEWLAFYQELNSGNLDLEGLGQEYDFIRADFIKDQENAKTQITDESGSVESERIAETTGGTSQEVREEGARPEQSQESNDEVSVAYVDGKKVSTSKKPIVTVRKTRKVTKKKFSKVERDADSSDVGVSVEALKKVLISKFGGSTLNFGEARMDSSPGSIYSPIQVHANPKEAERALGGTMELSELEDAQAFIDPRNPKVAHFIASNISPETAEGVIDHEVGVHLGIEALMHKDEVSLLARAVEEWGSAEEGSIERTVYDRAMSRVAFARATGMHESLADIELLAYAVEEAVNAGVKPSEDTQSRAAKWLNDVMNFFKMLRAKFIKNLLGEDASTEAVITPEELVALARAAGRANANNTIVENGADPSVEDEQTIMAYYAGADKRRPISPDASLGVVKTEPAERGQELFRWGKDSAYGPYSDVYTTAETSNEDGLVRFFVHVNAQNLNMDVLTTVVLEEVSEYPNVFVMTVWGPVDDAKGASKTKDVAGQNWGRLEGVTHGQNMKLLTEARRRLTRYQKGVVPNIVFNRVTGAAAKNSDQGRQGVVYMEDVRKRFSKKEQSKADAALGRVMGKGFAAQFTANMRQLVRSPLAILKPMSRIVRDVKESLPSASVFLETLYQQESTIQEQLLRVESILMATRELTGAQLAAMNDFISKSTFFQKWGYDPEIEGLDVKIDPVMKAAFDRLTPKAQEIVKSIFSYGAEMRETMQAVAEENGVKGVFEASKLQGPYAPLKRFGDYVAVLKSQALLDLQKEVKENPDDKKLAKKLDEMMSKEEHYVVSFFDTMGAAEKFTVEEGAKYASAQASEKAIGEFENRTSNPQAFAAVMAAIGADDTAGMDATTKANVKRIVEKLFYETLDEQNARLSGIRRKNRAGYDKDMVRAFVSHAQSQARLLAQLKHGKELSQSVRDMQKEASEDRPKLQNIVNILQQKYNNLLTRDDRSFAALQDSVTSFNSMYMLTTNVAYHVANATQPAISVAKIAGDFADYSGSWAALTRGYKEAKNIVDSSILKQLGTIGSVGFIDLGNTVQLIIDNAKPEHRALLKKLQLRQMLDVGIENDLNMEAVFDTGYDSLNTASEAFKNMSHRLYQSSRFVEAYNRIAVAVAAYDMAIKHRPKLKRLNMTPEEYAISIIEDTQGNYGTIDAPLAIDWLPKITTQFRKFQIIMGWLWGSTFKDAFFSADKETRGAGKLALGYIGLHVASLAGVRGLPFAGMIGTAALMFAGEEEDNEPLDLERWIRTNVEDEALADVLLMGLPSLLGVDLSAKLQQRDIFLPLNFEYIDASPDGEPSKNVAFNLLFGPTAGLIGNVDRAYDQYARGDIARATEYLLPRGQRSLLETLRFSQDGVSKKNGDVIMNPVDIDLGALIKNALGLPPTEIAKVKWTYGQQIELRNYFTDEQAKLKSQYKKALANKDREKQAQLRDEWRQLQRQKRNARPFFNDDPTALKMSPISDMLRVNIDKRKREMKAQRQLGTN